MFCFRAVFPVENPPLPAEPQSHSQAIAIYCPYLGGEYLGFRRIPKAGRSSLQRYIRYLDYTRLITGRRGAISTLSTLL
jgi:hypothetical protein